MPSCHLTNIPIVLDIRVEKFYSFIKKEYGLSAHIVDKDPEKEVAVISFEITHRYILAIFLDVRPIPFYRAQHHMCKYLLDYLGMITSDTSMGDKALEEHSVVLDNVLEKVIRECAPYSSDTGERLPRDSGRSMRNMLERRNPVDRGKSKNKSARRKKVLSLRTTGIIDIALYSCVCRRAS
ncbi:MAG: hypothetical protein ACTSUE_06500 [Promethearchaeota archaeon]